ncbi:MAG TPA: hypothetical protein VMU54_15985 [Planctomycetota bacterium]|nr:hypothetical protein [Planctomycetota bacterium]
MPHRILPLLLLAVAIDSPERTDPLTLEWGKEGLKSLRYAGHDWLADGILRVEGADAGKGASSVEKGSILRTCSWGRVRGDYSVSGTRLNIVLTVTNRSDKPIDAVQLSPIQLRLPAKSVEYDEVTPMIASNVGAPTILPLSTSMGRLVVVNEEIERPLYVGFPWALDRPKSTVFPLWVDTALRNSLPKSYPAVRRPIAPGDSDTYRLSIRFGPADASRRDLAGDLQQRFREAAPSTLQWADRRPIGALVLATSDTKWPKNPRGWFMDRNLDASSDDFRRKALDYADSSAKILREMGAQGAVVWDIEGQEFPHAVSYLGDPRLLAELAPEMDPVADEFFKRLRDAGLRTGICIRPSRIVKNPGTDPALGKTRYAHFSVDDIGAELSAKIVTAQKRWGCSLFYIDSNVLPGVNDTNLVPAALMESLAAKFPGTLLIPEQANARYWASTAPYRELRGGSSSTPEAVREIYPGSFSVVNTADGPIEKRRTELVGAVKRGDVLMFRAWWNDPANALVRGILEDARR